MLVVAARVLGITLALCVLAVPARAAEQMSGSFTVEHPAMKDLEKCRQTENQTLELIRCHEEAVIAFPTNYTWWSALALLYLRADMNHQAHEAMNRSVAGWINDIRDRFEAAGHNITQNATRWVDLLRFAYDEEGRPKEERQSEAIEMGLLLAKKFELEHFPTDAHSIYYEFLLQTGNGLSQTVDFHRRTGNLLGMVLTGPHNDSSVVWRIAESLMPAIDGLSEHLNTKGEGPFSIKRMCGIEFTSNEDITVADLVGYAETCVRKWGNLTAEMDAEDPNGLFGYTNSMREHALHRLAVAGATGILSEVIEHIGKRTIPGDRFGRGLVHYAAAWGREATLKMLLDLHGNVDQEDKGGVMPRHLGCQAPGFQAVFERLTGSSCEKFTQPKYIDEDAETTDDSGTDGGWNERHKRPAYYHCDFDVRDASRMTQSDLMIQYISTGRPVVLRNSFYETDGPHLNWKLKRFNRTYGKVLVRNEFFPRQARWGLGGITNVSTIAEFVDKINVPDGKVATVNVDHVKHPLNALVDEWLPPTFTNKKSANEIDFFDPSVTVATLQINKKGSQGHHFVRAQGIYHALVYGHQEWKLLPPRHARTLRTPLPPKFDAFAQRCELVTGDVLFVPDLWSASFVSKNNGVSFERYLYKTPRDGVATAPSGQQNDRISDSSSEL